MARKQSEPPFLFLTEIRKSLTAIDRVGPRATQAVLRRVSDILLPGNVRQPTLNGSHIGWEYSSSQGQVAFRKALLGPAGPTLGLSRQVSEVLSYRLARKRLVAFDHQPSTEEIDSLGLFEVPQREYAEWVGAWRCHGIGREWLTFYKEMLWTCPEKVASTN